MITIAILRAAGANESFIAKVAELEESERIATKRERDRIRQRNHRARNECHSDPCDPRDKGSSSFLLPSSSLSLSVATSTDSPLSKESLVEGRQLSDWPLDYRELFWAQYPNKVGKPVALQKLERVCHSGKVTWAEFKTGLDAYCAKTDDRPWCNPATWINQERWADQPAPRQMPMPLSRRDLEKEDWDHARSELRASIERDEQERESQAGHQPTLRLLPGSERR